MQITILPCSTTGQQSQMFTTYLINGNVAIDAGSLGLYGSIAEQARVKHLPAIRLPMLFGNAFWTSSTIRCDLCASGN